jgi:peptidoglycan/LPS O-acetylase OafA/YrhL
MNFFPWVRFAINPLWSLPYEVDMYILLPVLFLFAVRFKSAWATFSLMLACAAFALVQPHYSWFRSLDLIEYVGCFLPGIVAYQLSSRPRHRWPAWLWPIFLVLWSILFVGMNALHPNPRFLLRWPFCSVVGLVMPQFLQIPNGLIRRGAATIAKYSYGIYLTHTFALHISFVLMAAYPFLLRMGAFSAMMLAFPFAAYYLIEKPGIDLGKRLLAPSRPTQ